MVHLVSEITKEKCKLELTFSQIFEQCTQVDTGEQMPDNAREELWIQATRNTPLQHSKAHHPYTPPSHPTKVT